MNTCHDCGNMYRGTQTAGGHCTRCHESFHSNEAFDDHVVSGVGVCRTVATELDADGKPAWMRHPRTREWLRVRRYKPDTRYSTAGSGSDATEPATPTLTHPHTIGA